MKIAGPEVYSVYFDDPRGLLVAEKVARVQLLSAHIHTKVTDGWLSPERAVDTAIAAGAAFIAVTDHDRIGGSERAAAYISDHQLEDTIQAITGSEVSTQDGHILALGISGEIEKLQPVAHTIEEIHSKEGVAIVAHPDLAHTSSVSSQTIRSLVRDQGDTVQPDGCEVFNATGEALHNMTMALQRVPLVARHGFPADANTAARILFHAVLPGGAEFGGADAHGRKLNKVMTAFLGDDPIAAIRRGETAVVVNPMGFGFLANTAETIFMAKATAVTQTKNLLNWIKPR